MLNQYRQKKEERIKKIFDFESCFNSKEHENKVKECNYISNQGNFYKGKILLHKAALYIKLKEQIYDQNYFTVFWNMILSLELFSSKNSMRLKIYMNDQRIIELELFDNVLIQIESLLLTHLTNPTLLFCAKESFLQMQNQNKQSQNKEDSTQQENQKKEEAKIQDISDEFEDPLQQKKTQQQKQKKQEKISDQFFLPYQHSQIEQVVKSVEDLDKLGLKIIDNSDQKYCSSYPQFLIVPKQLQDIDLVEISKFRVKGRIPILSFINKNNQLFFRSSQIQTGIFSKRNHLDEMMLYFMGDPSTTVNREYYLQYHQAMIKKKSTLLVCDARSKMAAMGNKIIGKGWESEKFYSNISLTFHNIANLDDVIRSYKQIVNGKMNSEKQKQFYKNLGNSEWYEYISDLLEFSIEIIQKMEKQKTNVLLHCSDGWDRTAQVASLVQILMDKNNRTLKGFLEVIKKEFSDHGFQFSSRGNHFNKTTLEHSFNRAFQGQIKFKKNIHPKCSPIFLQFLEAVRQIMIQKPDEFEFNLDFIEDLSFYQSLGIFYEFIFNTQKIRKNYQDLLSVFEFAEYYKNDYLNHKFNIEKDEMYLNSLRIEAMFLQPWFSHFLQNVPFDQNKLFY